MSGPFLCYREIIPPTSVDAAKFFTHNGLDNYLITLTSGAISIYRVHSCVEQPEITDYFSLVLHSKVFGKPLDVNVFCPSEISVKDNQNDTPNAYTYILLNFDLGKLSIMRFDPSNCSLDVVSLYNAEEEAIGAGSEVHASTQGRQIFPGIGSSPQLVVDNEDSIACTLLYGQQFFFMNLSSLSDGNNCASLTTSSSATQRSVQSATQAKKESSSKQFIVDIQLSLRLLGPVLDYCFIPGYSRPALAILQDSGQLPAGHAATTRNTCCISVIAVDKVAKSVSLLWRQLMLPHDSICMVPLCHPTLRGSVALVSMNAIMLVTQECVTGAATCGFASATVSSHIKLQPSKLSEGLELDASRWIESDESGLVGSLKDGRLLSVQLHFSHELPVHGVRFDISLLATSIRCSCFCKSPTSDLWFLGSRLSDCLLIKVSKQHIDSYALEHSEVPTSSNDLGMTTPAAKRARRGSFSAQVETPHINGSSSSSKGAGSHLDVEAEECELYGAPLKPFLRELMRIGSDTSCVRSVPSSSSAPSSSGSSSSPALKYTLKVADTISVLGPVLDGIFCGNEESMDQAESVEWNRVGMPLRKIIPNPASAYIVDREARDSLHLYTGLDDQSGVYRITRGVKVSKLASRNFPGAIGALSLNSSSNMYSLLFVNFTDKSRLFQCTTSGAHIDSVDLGPSSGINYLPSDVAMREVSCADAGFMGAESTIAVGLVQEGVAVQVISQCVRVVNMGAESGMSGEALQDVFVADEIEMGGLGGVPGEVIVCADVCQPWVALLTSTGSVYLLEFDSSDETLVLKHSAKHQLAEEGDDESKVNMPSEESALSGSSRPSLESLLKTPPVSLSLFNGYFPTSHSHSVESDSLGLIDNGDAATAAVAVATLPLEQQQGLAESSSLSLILPITSDKSDDLAAEELLERLQALEELALYGEQPNEGNSSDCEGETPSARMQGHNAENASSSSAGPRRTPKRRQYDYCTDVESTEMAVEEEEDPSAEEKEKEETEGMHLVLCDADGNINVVSLHDMKVIFRADDVCRLPRTFPLSSTAPTMASGGEEEPSPAHVQVPMTPITPITPITPSGSASESATRLGSSSDRVLLDARFVRLGRSDSPLELSKLCLMLVLESSDVIVYYLADSHGPKSPQAAGAGTGTGIGTTRGVHSPSHSSFFVKLEHSVVTRKRKNRYRKRNIMLNGANSSDAHMRGPGSSQFSRDMEDMCPQRIQVSKSMDGRTTVLVSGSRPLVVSNDSGIPFLAPIGLPELPFSNSGTYILAPFCVGSVKGIASLWVENEDAPHTAGGAPSLSESKKQSSLQLYQEVPGLICYPGGVVTARKMHTGVTTHRCVELLAKSEDSTEQALLKRRTFVLACSTEKKVPFLSSVLTDAEKEKEESFYDRFFPSLESFAQPDLRVGAAPDLSIREHKLVIMQSGTAVDEYILPRGEQVLGIEPLYLTVSTTTVIPALFPISQAIVMEKKAKRVFLAACTCVEDKHGEDTQGEGRIMLFGLDYALFQDAVVDSSEAKEGDELPEGDAPAPSSSSALALSASSSASQSKSQQSTEQAKFFKAIQPKLKLLWTGPGPASIVKQIGEYILSTVSTTIYVYKLNSETMELDQITFYFAQFFISSISVIKNYIVIADVCNSVQFLVWREEDLTLTLVSKDMDSQTVLSTAFISDGAALGIVVGDDEANIQLMKFDPRKIETKDGSRLHCLADFHLGSDATLLLPHSLLLAPALLQPPLPPMPPPMQPPLPPMPPPLMGHQIGLGLPPLPPHALPPTLGFPLSAPRISRPRQSVTSAIGQPFGQRLDKLTGPKSCVLIGTIDGGLGMMIPVEERMYRRLALLQQIMRMGVPTPCALNPREYRLIKTTRFVAEKKKGVLDGTLLWKYVSLESGLQDELAAAMGVTADTILENLLELDLLGTFF